MTFSPHLLVALAKCARGSVSYHTLTYFGCLRAKIDISFQKSKYAVRDRVIEFALEKKDSGPYWKRLVKEEKKQHWLKIDFNKWRDEDESDEEAGGGQDLEEVKLI